MASRSVYRARRSVFRALRSVFRARRAALFTLTLLACVIASAPLQIRIAHAQAPTFSQRQVAKSLFSQARLAYRNGDYEEAILKWQESFSLSQEPLILESIANAYEKLGDRKRALENLENWRKAAPKNEQKALDDRIVLLRERVKADGAEEQLRKDA